MSKLAKACEASLTRWLETFPEEIPEAECTEKHEKWKKNLFNKMRDGYYHRFTTRTVKIMLVAAILSALILTAFVIPSSREFILDEFDKYSTYKLTENNMNSVNDEIVVGYIPEGYILESYDNSGKQIIYKYSNSENSCFTIFKHSSSIKIDFNTEKSVVEELTVGCVKYMYCMGNFGMNSIIWQKEDYVYQIDASFNKEELIKIAKFVK